MRGTVQSRKYGTAPSRQNDQEPRPFAPCRRVRHPPGSFQFEKRHYAISLLDTDRQG